MDKIFYTAKDRCLFWISGYSDTNENVVGYTQYLLENANIFANYFNIPVELVNSYYNTQPPMYQYMRIFYIYDVEMPKDKGVMLLKDHWTLNKWITS